MLKIKTTFRIYLTILNSILTSRRKRMPRNPPCLVDVLEGALWSCSEQQSEQEPVAHFPLEMSPSVLLVRAVRLNIQDPAMVVQSRVCRALTFSRKVSQGTNAWQRVTLTVCRNGKPTNAGFMFRTLQCGKCTNANSHCRSHTKSLVNADCKFTFRAIRSWPSAPRELGS